LEKIAASHECGNWEFCLYVKLKNAKKMRVRKIIQAIVRETQHSKRKFEGKESNPNIDDLGTFLGPIPPCIDVVIEGKRQRIFSNPHPEVKIIEALRVSERGVRRGVVQDPPTKDWSGAPHPPIPAKMAFPNVPAPPPRTGGRNKMTKPDDFLSKKHDCWLKRNTKMIEFQMVRFRPLEKKVS